MTKTELALAYDALLETLKVREKNIEERIKKQINHLGKEERILFEGKNFDKEFEDLPNFESVISEHSQIEQILSVNEQIRNVTDFKDITP